MGLTQEQWALLIIAVILNCAIGLVFYKTIREVAIRDIVTEKAASPEAGPETSSSRVIGFLGGMTMTCFMWAVANVVIFLGITKPSDVTNFLSSIGGFLLSGAALFLPYAVNKLTDVAKPPTPSVDRGKADKDAKDKGDRAKVAQEEADKAIAAAAALSQLTADKAKSVVADAIKAATSSG